MRKQSIQTYNSNVPDKTQNTPNHDRIGDLPEWDLSDLYEDPSTKTIKKDLKK